jgi:hypothetical protein
VCRDAKPGLERRVHAIEQAVDGPHACADRVDDLAIAQQPVLEQGTGIGGPVLDRTAVGRDIVPVGQVDDLAQRVEILRHRPVGDRDQRRVPAHDVVAGQQPFIPGDAEGEMVGAVTGRRNGGESDAANLELLAIEQRPVGLKVPVALAPEQVDFEQARRAAEPVRPAKPQRRAGEPREGGSTVGMIAVGVGEEDRLDRAPGDSCEEGIAVRRIVGPRVEDAYAVGADDEAVRAGEGVGAGVRGGHAQYAVDDGNCLARPGRKSGVEDEGSLGGDHCACRGERLETGDLTRVQKR